MNKNCNFSIKPRLKGIILVPPFFSIAVIGSSRCSDVWWRQLFWSQVESHWSRFVSKLLTHNGTFLRAESCIFLRETEDNLNWKDKIIHPLSVRFLSDFLLWSLSLSDRDERIETRYKKVMYTYEYLFCTEKSQIEPLSLEPQSQVWLERLIKSSIIVTIWPEKVK